MTTVRSTLNTLMTECLLDAQKMALEERLRAATGWKEEEQ